MSYASFVAGLSELTVTGLKRQYDEPPGQLAASDMPAMFPRLPTGGAGAVTFSGMLGLSTCTVDLVIAVQPYYQARAAANYDAVLTAMDNLQTALADNAQSLDVDTWTITATIEPLLDGVTPIWVVTARVTGSF